MFACVCGCVLVDCICIAAFLRNKVYVNDFTICVCLADADIMLLLRMFYAFFFSSYSSFSPNLRSILHSGNERDNLNFNAMSRMVSIRSEMVLTS